jgi:hypothetical protein
MASGSGKTSNSYSIFLTYNKGGDKRTITSEQNSALSPITDSGYGPNDPMRLSDPSKPMFNVNGPAPQAPGDEGQYVDGNGTHYMTWVFFKSNKPTDTDLTNLINTLSATDVSDIVLHIQLKVRVTNLGDSVSNIDGRLTNDVASDVRGAKEEPPQDSSHTPSASFQFAKTASDSISPVEGAVFRLTQPGNSSNFLGSDGQFHTDNWYKDASQNTDHVFPMTATSNNRGIVSFTGLPLLNSARNDWNNAARTLDVYEYEAPANTLECVKDNTGICKTDAQGHTVYKEYVRATMPFRRISFTNVMGTQENPSNFNNYINSLNTDSKVLPDGWADMENGRTTNTDNYPLQFGKWSVDYDIYKDHMFKTVTGDSVYEAMRNFVKGERTPIQLPLTGGVGIVLLLLAGAAIIAIVAIERKHRLAAARR